MRIKAKGILERRFDTLDDRRSRDIVKEFQESYKDTRLVKHDGATSQQQQLIWRQFRDISGNLTQHQCNSEKFIDSPFCRANEAL